MKFSAKTMRIRKNVAEQAAPCAVLISNKELWCVARVTYTTYEFQAQNRLVLETIFPGGIGTKAELFRYFEISNN